MPNRLAAETSPYLLQHADNPVDWYPWGEEALGPGPRRGPADPRLDRLRRLPLVPRDGAGVLRGPADRGADERALRLHQGRPRGAPGRRRDLHGRRPGDDRARRVAAERVPDARRGPVLRRHLLPARAAPGDAVVAAGDRRRGRGVARPAAGDRRDRPPDPAAARRRRRPAPGRGRAGPGRARRRGDDPPARLRPAARRLHDRRAEVPARVGDRVPARARGAADGAAHAARDGLGRDVRPDRRRLRALQRRRPLGDPALREDALRQRAARARVPARVPGVGRAVLRARLLRDARLGAARPAPGGGRVRLRARRGLRGGRGEVLRLDARRAARRARRRRGGGDRVLRPRPPGELRGDAGRRSGRRATPRTSPRSSCGCARCARRGSGPRSTTSA